jgi:HK97 family phage prohead protease
MRNGKHAKVGDIRHKLLPFTSSLKAADFESNTDGGRYAGYLKGYAAGILNIDRGEDIIFPGAFITLDQFLLSGVVAWQHDWTNPIGKPLVAREVLEPDYGLYTEARISKTTTGNDCMVLIRDEVVTKLSIGYRLLEGGYNFVNRDGLEGLLKQYNINEVKRSEILADFDRRKLEEVFALTKIELFEYSPVTLPMNPEADITGSKNLGGALDGLPFAYHPAMVASAVRGIAERVTEFKNVRASDKRKVSPAHVTGLKMVVDELEEALDVTKLLLGELEKDAATAPDPQTPPATTGISAEDGGRLYAEYLKQQARELGVAV